MIAMLSSRLKNIKDRYILWSCQKVCEAFTFVLDNIYFRFGTKLYRQIVGIPIGTNCAPLVADLFLFCNEMDFMISLSRDTEAETIEAFNSTSKYLDDLLNMNSRSFRPLSHSPRSRFSQFTFRPDSFRSRVVSPTFPFTPKSFRQLSRSSRVVSPLINFVSSSIISV